jgi:4-aminobutyrate aminotransferase/(S)-3-amino-2-methylpropionate transaminase
VLGRAAIMDAVEPGGMGGTYGGSPLGCAAALAVLDVIEEEGLLQRASFIGARIRSALEPLMSATTGTPVASLRGLGAMLGFDVVKSRASGEPDGPSAKKVVATALQKGLIVLTCGTQGETIRILVPLTIPDADLDAGLAILKGILAEG